MTFQHNKFEDSPVMRSLTKIAHEKGWIKDVPVVKTAAPKLDLNPTNDLLENLLKLSNGLRHSGFDKQADEIESKFVAYKQAQSLYNTHNESGEDLINSAHPKGSHKLVDVDSKEAVFEDILDQHMKSVDMVEKKPTGKLASSRDIVNAVKVALGVHFLALAQDGSDSLYEAAKDAVEKFRAAYDNIATRMGDDAGENDQYFNMLKNVLDRKDVHKQQGDFAASLTDSMNSLKSGIEPSYLSWEHSSFSPVQQQKWEAVQKWFPPLKAQADKFHAVVSQIQTIESKIQDQKDAEEVRQTNQETSQSPSTPVPSGPSDQVIQKYKDAIDNIGIMKTVLQSKNLPNSAALIGWLDQANAFANKNLADFTKSQYKDKQEVITSFLDQVNNVLQPKLDAFKQKWSV
jgi:hypothetical protein